MPLDSELAATGYQPGSPRQRLVSSLLSAAILVLALLLAITQTGFVPALVKKTAALTTFDVVNHEREKGGSEPQKQKQKQEKHTEHKTSVPVVTEKPVEQPAAAKKQAFTFLRMSSNDFAAADIGKMKGESSASGDQAPGGSGGTYGPGEGPGGMVLYNAAWFHEPTDAQLAGYLPDHRPTSGWGEIACQTQPHYKVDNCQILAESPRGSGFGRAVLNAAWQFEVQPPRINGKAQIGSWVRIRITYSERGISS
ncbi:hypothetical protein EDF56_1011140 [Novosphingobium sp. PhB165]|uniref:hypothetical protein n=1 Tax=Novosphingobium sp. PhB165 TaxID=2485105 RepID=UPI001050212F|nr:hypothetical protein [Novosphingobium sp. PhB165]TCM22449.1 hypothetical protein EDF56_1011140 [Novosphingobium sp. PhB165]